MAHLHGRRTSDPRGHAFDSDSARLPVTRCCDGPGVSRQEFTCIGKEYANRLVGEMAQGLGYDTLIKEVSDKQVVRIHQLLREVHFDAADGDCLSPAGEYNLRLGIMKELRPNMVATYNAGVGVFEGNPFVVEAGVSLGGKDVPTVRASKL
jgi:DNA topoisomerase-6 subunit B